MALLGLVGYPEFQALRMEATAFGALADAAATEAAAALASFGGVLLGGFAGGYLVGQEILKGLNQPNLLPDPVPTITGGNDANMYVLTIVTNDTLFGKQTTEKTITGAFGAIFFQYSQPESGRYVIATSRGLVPIININVENIIDAPVVISARRVDGTPEAFRTNPSFPQKKPTTVPVISPTTVPFPNFTPSFPITPEIYPSPETNPDQEPNRLFPPGITVKIPETGDQFTFSPTGVSYGRSTPVTPYPLENPAPQIPPPGKKVAVEPCPCPPGDKTDLTEVLCRLKAIEDEVLSNGYEYTNHPVGSGQGVVVDISPGEIFSVSIQITDFADNTRSQPVAAGTPTVYYAGWFSWVYKNFPGDRLPINYLNTNWIAPPNATGYLYSLHQYAIATSSYQTRAKKDYIDAC